MNTTTDLHNPYLATHSNINGRLAEPINRAKNWRLFACGLLVANVVQSGGIVYISQQQQQIPYIVTDKRATELTATTIQNPAVIKAELADFIHDLRMLTTDTNVRIKQRNHALSQCLTPAQNFLHQYYAENPVDVLMSQGGVYPDSIEVWPSSENSVRSWRAEWVEALQDDNGVKATSTWTAEIDVVFVPPKTAEEREASPFGIWISKIHIGPAEGRSVHAHNS